MLVWPVASVALRVTPWAFTTSPAAMVAVLVETARFRATAAPTPTLLVPVWLPSALAVPEVWLLPARVSRPPLVTVSPSPMAAVVVAVSTFTPTAAATLTAPSLLEALGVVGLLSASLVLASLPAASPAVSAALLCAATCWSTDLPAPPLPSVALPLLSAVAPPATLAVALALVPERLVAFRVTAPPAARFRSTVAVTVSVVVVRAREAPTATLLPWVWPVATVVTELVWVASAS